LAFDLLTIIQVSSQLLGGVITICLALYGLGAMALAIGSLTTAIITLLLSWMFAPGLISLEFRGYHLRELLGYGSGALFIGIANSLVNRVDNLIVARQLGSEAVGLYQRAFHLVMLPLQHVTGSVHKVLFAAMSSIQKENARFQRAYLKAVRLSALVAFPLLTMLGTSADVIIPFVYGPMWEGTVPILQLLTTVGILRILSNTQGLVVQASGRPMTEAVLQAVWLALIIILGFLGSRAGVLGVVVGVFLATCIFCICMTYLAHSIIDIKVVEWLKAMQTGILGSVAMGLGILSAKTFCSTVFSDFVLLIVMTLFGLLVYITAVRFCHTYDDNELLSIVSEFSPPRLRYMMCLILGITPR
jgi:PST family polysaccharide transporter